MRQWCVYGHVIDEIERRFKTSAIPKVEFIKVHHMSMVISMQYSQPIAAWMPSDTADAVKAHGAG